MRNHPCLQLFFCGVQGQLWLQVETIVLGVAPNKRDALANPPGLPYIRRNVSHREANALRTPAIWTALVYQVEVV